MTVEQLINELKAYDPQAKVIVEINGMDTKLKEVYQDGKNHICLFTDGKEIRGNWGGGS